MLLLAAVLVLLCSPVADANTVRIDTVADFSRGQSFGQPSSVSFSASFQWDTVANNIVPGTLSFASSDPLGPFHLGVSVGLFGWTDTAGNAFQIDFFNHDQAPPGCSIRPCFPRSPTMVLDLWTKSACRSHTARFSPPVVET